MNMSQEVVLLLKNWTGERCDHKLSLNETECLQSFVIKENEGEEDERGLKIE